MSNINASIALPFVAQSMSGGMDMWSPEVSGNWGVDNRVGRKYASELLVYVQKKNDPTLLGRVMMAMIGRGDYGGVEVGFFQQISEHLLKQALQSDDEHADRDAGDQGPERSRARHIHPIALGHGPCRCARCQ